MLKGEIMKKIKIISISVDKKNLKKFDGLLDEKMITRSRIFEKLMCEQIENWEKGD